MEYLDQFNLGFGVFAALVLLAYVARQVWARSLARGRRPVTGRVVAVSRKEVEGNRFYAYGVDTVYEVAGHGELTHWRGFETEGQAILFSRLHKEGSTHKVVPNDSEPGQVFLWEELGRTDWNWLYLALVGVVSLGTAVYAVMEYYGD